MAHAAKILEKRKKRTEGNESSAIKKAKGSDGTVIPHFKNKQRVLVLCTRGVTQRYRHLMSDMIKLLPHSKKEVKMQQKEQLFVINEIAEMKSCNNCLFFEVRYFLRSILLCVHSRFPFIFFIGCGEAGNTIIEVYVCVCFKSCLIHAFSSCASVCQAIL
jgi:hypothetical protein